MYPYQYVIISSVIVLQIRISTLGDFRKIWRHRFENKRAYCTTTSTYTRVEVSQQDVAIN